MCGTKSQKGTEEMEKARRVLRRIDTEGVAAVVSLLAITILFVMLSSSIIRSGGAMAAEINKPSSDIAEMTEKTVTTETMTSTTTSITTSTTTVTSTTVSTEQITTTSTTNGNENQSGELITQNDADFIATTLEEVDMSNDTVKIGSSYQFSKGDFIELCNLVGREYGADIVPVAEKALVVQTVVNRVTSPHFPNNVEDVIAQPNQYTGWLSRTDYSSSVTESVREAVLYCLNGNVSNDFVFYWGDGYNNYFYTFEEYPMFEKDLSRFLAGKA